MSFLKKRQKLNTEGRYAIFDKSRVCIFWGIDEVGNAIVEFQKNHKNGIRYYFKKVDPLKVEIISNHDMVDFNELKEMLIKIPAYKGAFRHG